MDFHVTCAPLSQAMLPSGATAAMETPSAMCFGAAPAASEICWSTPSWPIANRLPPSIDQWTRDPLAIWVMLRGLRICEGGCVGRGPVLGVGAGVGRVLNTTGLIFETGWLCAVDADVTVTVYCVFADSPFLGVSVRTLCCSSHDRLTAVAGWMSSCTESVFIGWLNWSTIGWSRMVASSCVLFCGLTTATSIRSCCWGPSERNATVTIRTAPTSAPAMAIGWGARRRWYHGFGGLAASSHASRMRRRRRSCRNLTLGSM